MAGIEPHGAASAAPGFPVTVTNCGRQWTYDRPPERVVTDIYQGIINLGPIVGIPDRAAELRRKLDNLVADVRQRGDGREPVSESRTPARWRGAAGW